VELGSKFFLIIALAKETVKFADKGKGLQGHDQTMPTSIHCITYVHSALCSDVIEERERERNPRTFCVALASDVPSPPPTLSYIRVTDFCYFSLLPLFS
jgi:hypothetical protein